MGWEHFAGHCYLALDQVIIVDDQLSDNRPPPVASVGAGKELVYRHF